LGWGSSPPKFSQNHAPKQAPEKIRAFCERTFFPQLPANWGVVLEKSVSQNACPKVKSSQNTTVNGSASVNSEMHFDEQDITHPFGSGQTGCDR